MVDVITPAAVAVTSGVVTLSVALFGVEPQAVFYGIVGSTLGVSLAPQAGNWRAVIVFVAVSVAAAALGTWVADEYFSRPAARNGLSLVLGAVFHPLFAGVVGRIPEILDGVLRRLGLKS
jgi:hypothetical protein